jgi:hypothetical protein
MCPLNSDLFIFLPVFEDESMTGILSMTEKSFLAAPNALATDEKCGDAFPIEKAIQRNSFLKKFIFFFSLNQKFIILRTTHDNGKENV